MQMLTISLPLWISHGRKANRVDCEGSWTGEDLGVCCEKHLQAVLV